MPDDPDTLAAIQERHRSRIVTNVLPRFSSPTSAEREKYASYATKTPWIVAIPVPLLPTHRIGLCCVNPHKLYALTITRLGRRRGSLFLLLLFIIFAVFVMVLLLRREQHTLVFTREDLQRIWHWEISSGHFPSRQGIPEEMQFRFPIENPALPPQLVSNYPSEIYATTTWGTGPRRSYFDLRSAPAKSGFPPRPVPGSIVDLDIIMQHCAFERNKFVRDCLEVLRVGAGLDNGKKTRRGKLDDWRYIYLEQTQNATFETRDFQYLDVESASPEPGGGLRKHRSEDWENPPIPLRRPPRHVSPSANPASCDPENPRIFHMFWAGEFTDKPYLALLSFLFTQNTGLHLKTYPADGPCRPQFWVWINPGPAASIPNPTALNDMFDHLKSNPWSSPFLHPRLKDVIRFKLWNTTEQLDHIPELRDKWRTKDLFRSVGKSPKAAGLSRIKDPAGIDNDPMNVTHFAGSKSSDTYDQLSVVLSDMARFIFCHRFGGIYLDADTIFLRDWEELWGWKGAFAYRWSRMESYNTAVLHLNKDSALGSFIFKTALKNKMDFHPHTVWKYVKDAHLEDLLLRLPDALFDSAWLNTEGFQLTRPPQPFFTDFKHFFETPSRDSAAPQALGFEGFFRGAYSYHYHNFWWKPFDPSRNWPDLGPRFVEGEKLLKRPAAAAEKEAGPDQRDLDWSTVLKRVMESYIRSEIPNMYGEMLVWSDP